MDANIRLSNTAQRIKMYYIIAFCMGIAIALQSPINALLGKSLQSPPLIPALISFMIGTICLLILSYFSGVLNISVFKNLVSEPLWKLSGGVLGAFMVFGTILLAPKIGLVNMFLIMIISQLLTSLLLDSIGAFGLSRKAYKFV
ncbi:MAG: DMT family transporter [Helicobacteraceae bacterium]|nr:DMT family transporter [Helicobacteraceae bacterium]